MIKLLVKDVDQAKQVFRTLSPLIIKHTDFIFVGAAWRIARKVLKEMFQPEVIEEWELPKKMLRVQYALANCEAWQLSDALKLNNDPLDDPDVFMIVIYESMPKEVVNQFISPAYSHPK